MTHKSKYTACATITFVVFLTGCGDTVQQAVTDSKGSESGAMESSSASDPRPSDPGQLNSERSLPSYEVVDRKTYDVPAKTQIELHAVVSGTLTETGLKQLLKKLYEEANTSRGFKYHSGKPTHVFIYVYTSREHYDAHFGQWIAMLSKAGERSGIDTKIKTELIAQADAKPEVKHSFSEPKRKEIFKAIVSAEDRAHADVERVYPMPEIQQLPRFSQADLRELFMKQVDALTPLMQKYKAEVADRFDGRKKGSGLFFARAAAGVERGAKVQPRGRASFNGRCRKASPAGCNAAAPRLRLPFAAD
ncbi:MAG: hypothetical protein WD669_10095 [Pirellulales bacterium]